MILKHWRCDTKKFSRIMDNGLNYGILFNTEGRGGQRVRGVVEAEKAVEDVDLGQ